MIRPLMKTLLTDQTSDIPSAVQVYLIEKRSLKYLENGVEDYVRQLKRQKRHQA